MLIDSTIWAQKPPRDIAGIVSGPEVVVAGFLISFFAGEVVVFDKLRRGSLAFLPIQQFLNSIVIAFRNQYHSILQLNPLLTALMRIDL